MAIDAVELLVGSRATSVNKVSGQETRSRRWLVATTDPDEARLAGGIPRDRSETFPGDARLRLQAVSTSPTGNGQTYVDASYSNFTSGGSGRTPPPTADLAGKKDWMWGSVTAIVEAPLNIRATYSKPNSTPGSPTKTYVWTLSKLKFQETRVQRILKVYVVIDSDADIARFDVIASQLNHLHLIRGAYYLYCPPLNNVRKINDKTFEVTHVWEQDQGTPMPKYGVDITPAPDSQPKAIIVPGSGRENTLRDPYAVLTALPPDQPETDTFDTVQIFPYPIDDDGWRTLPGVPNLG